MSMYGIWVSFVTIVHREIHRVLRIWSQTLIPPMITQTLYFVVFGTLIGSQIDNIHGVPYIAFIVPGLVMMSVINNAYSNVVSSFFGAKFQRHIEELLVSPTPNWTILVGYVVGGVFRGLLVGCLVFCVSFAFTRPHIYNAWVIVLFCLLTAVVFALGGFINAVFAKRFDDISIFPTFILMPLTYLGGIFYSIHDLPPLWTRISLCNPILYMVNGFRFGFYGFSDVSVGMSFGILIIFVALLSGISLYLLHKGIGLKN